MNRLRVSARVAPALVVVVAAVVGPWVAPHPVDRPVTFPFAGPSGEALLGGDQLGRDVLSRFLNGGWDLLLLAVVMAVLVTALAALIGCAAALRTGLGEWIERSADLLILLPPVLATLILMLTWPQLGAYGLVVIALVLGTPYSARVFAAAAAPFAATGFVEVAVANGERLPSLILRETLPNLRSTVATQFGLRFVESIYLVGTAAFLQLPTTLSESNWATMVRECVGPGMQLNPWSVLAPSLGIIALAFGMQRMIGVWTAAGKRANE
ncbi:ABC transporter permease subunit [Nocardia alba]|uniref:Peptide/nickel transport system permease protein n=1 Tax=Nocardia alba TaxID=225051 RepID=A0A4R1FJE3_9NOCA|nr:ABC transporter permease subunit [Nocardia alba]TCJ94966.1 peptide/nickel transport system permease protein [Nocardia alba]